ncbi:MAG TPA: homoserine dehydrogenase [Bacilli bacterium]|nr:homoserine dehydrogenase [Bacilli bacterium]
MNNKIKIAILGLGTVGFGVYDIIDKAPYLKNVVVSKILDQDLTKQKLVSKAEVTINYNDIINDKDIKIVVETMGAGEFSYHCIKRALAAKKHVITANKEVIALHLDELNNLKIKNKVSLLYEAAVGGGIPLIYPLYEIVKVNEVDEIVGILNGTTNFMLTKMFQDGLSFASSLKLAQDKGFAEADPTADLEGLDMVRKIAILSSIAYQGEIDINEIDHFGITTLNDLDLANIKKLGGVLKLVATSKRNKDKISQYIEPTIFPRNNIFSTVNEEYNLVAINASINGNLKFYGKGAGRYPTANAIVNDIIAIVEGRQNYTFANINKLEMVDASESNKYYVRLKKNEAISPEYIAQAEDGYLITQDITRAVLKQIITKVDFYAKIID